MEKLSSLENKKILLTCGPTWVPIDGVRVISNQSTGELGIRLANRLSKKKAKVTVIKGPLTHLTTINNCKVLKYAFYNELYRLIRREAKKNYDVIIHAAAVSDFKVKNAPQGKLKSTRSSVCITLVPTEKIIEKIKKWSPKSLLIGFKLENTTKRELVEKASCLIKKADCDLIIANRLIKKSYQGYIINKKGSVISQAQSRAQLVQRLVKEIGNRFTK